MAIAVPTDLDVEVLERQAEALDQHAERLREQAREAAREAADLRVAAARASRESVGIMRQRIGVHKDLNTLTRITTALKEGGPMKSADLAARLDLPQQRILQGLRVLEGTKAVVRSGIRRGTIWGLAEDEDLVSHHNAATAYTLVRDAVRKLDTFDFETIDHELQMLTTASIRRELPKLVAEGVLEEVREGTRKIWAYVRPTGPTVNRPKNKPPEAKVVEFARKSGPIEGTGRRTPVRKDVGELLEACTKAGMEIERTAKHWRVIYGGIVVTTLPQTPSDRRSLLNARAEIRRATGIEI